MAGPVVDLVYIVSLSQRRKVGKGITMLEASTRCRFVVTVVNCYTGRWSELHVDPGATKAQNVFWKGPSLLSWQTQENQNPPRAHFHAHPHHAALNTRTSRAG